MLVGDRTAPVRERVAERLLLGLFPQFFYELGDNRVRAHGLDQDDVGPLRIIRSGPCHSLPRLTRTFEIALVSAFVALCT